jgi:hypothetical protein
LYLLVFLSIFPLKLALDFGGKPDIYLSGTSQNFKHRKNVNKTLIANVKINLIIFFL